MPYLKQRPVVYNFYPLGFDEVTYLRFHPSDFRSSPTSKLKKIPENVLDLVPPSKKFEDLIKSRVEYKIRGA